MKYIKLFEDFDSYDPYELMIMFPNKKAEMIVGEIRKYEPNLNLISDLIVLGANLDWQGEDNDGYAPLHYATGNGQVEIVRMLIEAGANVNVQNEWEQTPLHKAVGRVEIARMLIEAGADLDIQDDRGQTPLHVAARNGKVEVTRMLIGAKANLNVQDEDGWTALHEAAYYGEIKIARMLIDAEARKDIQDNKGRLPYELTDSQSLKKLLRL